MGMSEMDPLPPPVAVSTEQTFPPVSSFIAPDRVIAIPPAEPASDDAATPWTLGRVDLNV